MRLWSGSTPEQMLAAVTEVLGYVPSGWMLSPFRPLAVWFFEREG